MDNSLNNKMVRNAFYVLIALNVGLLLWRGYYWLQGTEQIYSFGIPLGFIFLLAAMLVGKERNAALYYVLFGASVLSMLASLAGLIINWQ